MYDVFLHNTTRLYLTFYIFHSIFFSMKNSVTMVIYRLNSLNGCKPSNPVTKISWGQGGQPGAEKEEDFTISVENFN